MICSKQAIKILQNTSLTAMAFLLLFQTGALADSNLSTGMEIKDSSGNVFMEEVIDPEEEARKERERKRIRPIDRHRLSPEELKNLGVQMAPSGALVPLINKNPYAPPVRRNRSKLTAETTPSWMYNPYFTSPFAYPGIYPGTYPGIVPNSFPGTFPGAVPYSMYRPYMVRPNIFAGPGFLGMGSRTTITYGDSPQPQVSRTFTMPPVTPGLPFFNRYNRGGIYGGFRTGAGSNLNFFLPNISEYSFDSTVTPLIQ